MSEEAIQEAKNTFERWLEAFNARDDQGMVAEMHFPHHRLVATKFDSWSTAEEYAAGQRAIDERLVDEGWDHTFLVSMQAVQSIANKVHLVLHQSRRKKDGTEYNGFDTLWVFTKVDGRWGAILRSSFLTAEAQVYTN